MYRVLFTKFSASLAAAGLQLRHNTTPASSSTAAAAVAPPHPTGTASAVAFAIPDSTAKLEEMAETFSQLTLKEITVLQRLIFQKMGHSNDFYEKALLQGLGGGGGGMATGTAPAPAAAPVAPAAAAADGAGAAAKPEKKKVEKLTVDVKLEAYAPEIKIKLIKELRGVTSMSIADAKKAVEKCPGLVASNMSKADADKLKAAFEKLGAKVELI